MRPRHIALAVLLAVIWGFNWVVIKIGLAGVSPLALCFARFLLVSIPAIFFIKRPAAPLKLIALYGLTMFACQFSLLFIGMYLGITAGLASLLVQAQVFFTILLAVSFLGEKINKWQILGALISFTGIGVIGIHWSNNISLMGFMLVIAAAVSWSIGNLIAKKLHKVDAFSLIIWGSFISLLPTLLASLWFEGVDKFIYCFYHLSWTSFAAILYLVIASTLFGFTTWCWLLTKYPMSTVAPFSLLVPIIAMLSSALVLKESFQSWKILAATLVITGLGVNILLTKMTGGNKISKK